MRVFLSLRNRRRDERGAVAIIVAALAVTLLIMSAFVVDFGQAYVNKRQAQTAADAGALAAGQVYAADNTGRACAALDADSTLEDAARSEADGILDANMPDDPDDPSDDDKVTGILDVSCVDDTTDPTCVPSVTCVGTLQVKYTVNAESPIGLGALATGTDHMNVTRWATVGFGRTQKSVGNLRPWMICGAQIPTTFPSKVLEIGLPGNGHKPPPASCNVKKPGDWWRTTCFNPDGKGGGSHGDTSTNITTGCTSIQIVPGQPTGALDTPPNRSKALTDACKVTGKSGERPYCLADDTGSVTGFDDEWDTLIGETVAMPVFCDNDGTAAADCNPTSVPSTSGANWPVWKIAAVTVCGYAFKKQRSSDTLPSECSGSNPDGAAPSHFGDKDSGLLLLFKGIIAAGGSMTFTVETDTTMRLVE